ncbi:MAG: hypothetical protein JO057_21210, partial [Chloroflexi bacterium]|nr:hypothetical protein [Chloroflexota bacterium]
VALGGSLALTGVALFSKESAFAAVALLPCLLVLEARAFGADWRAAAVRARLAAPYLALALVVFGVRLVVLGRLGGTHDPSQVVGSSWQVLGAYTRDVIWFLAPLASSTHVIWLVLGAALVLGLALAGARLPRRQSALLLMGWLWIVAFGAFAMLLRIATVAWLAYFALPGVAIVWAAGFEGVVERLRGFAWRTAWPSSATSALLGVCLAGFAVGWLADSALVRRYDQWHVAGDVMQGYTDALTECVTSVPDISHVRLEGMPTALDDGQPETNQLGVTLFEDYTIQAALRLFFPQRDLTYTVWSRQTLHGPDADPHFACTSDSSRIILTATYAPE